MTEFTEQPYAGESAARAIPAEPPRETFPLALGDKDAQHDQVARLLVASHVKDEDAAPAPETTPAED